MKKNSRNHSFSSIDFSGLKETSRSPEQKRRTLEKLKVTEKENKVITYPYYIATAAVAAILFLLFIPQWGIIGGDGNQNTNATGMSETEELIDDSGEGVDAEINQDELVATNDDEYIGMQWYNEPGNIYIQGADLDRNDEQVDQLIQQIELAEKEEVDLILKLEMEYFRNEFNQNQENYYLYFDRFVGEERVFSTVFFLVGEQEIIIEDSYDHNTDIYKVKAHDAEEIFRTAGMVLEQEREQKMMADQILIEACVWDHPNREYLITMDRKDTTLPFPCIQPIFEDSTVSLYRNPKDEMDISYFEMVRDGYAALLGLSIDIGVTDRSIGRGKFIEVIKTTNDYTITSAKDSHAEKGYEIIVRGELEDGVEYKVAVTDWKEQHSIEELIHILENDVLPDLLNW
ncbi:MULTISPECIES: hypothetical protein [Bacillaceae]|uniref:Uncharacterized protein n=1 Tax=Evansella alkalicola TaxID=745819 RepID=A0ABS6JQY8_9BACI|nr:MULTISPECIES: hypothetical protein [Bacillaceae]MBU9720969.1 hypothetical protein [Bacillus alkalicola]